MLIDIGMTIMEHLLKILIIHALNTVLYFVFLAKSQIHYSTAHFYLILFNFCPKQKILQKL